MRQARNGLENFAYSMRNTVQDSGVADKLSAEDKDAINKAVDGVIEWLDNNQVRRRGAEWPSALTRCVAVCCHIQDGIFSTCYQG